jgi:hypothetical protein
MQLTDRRDIEFCVQQQHRIASTSVMNHNH